MLDLGSHVFDLADIYGDYDVEAHFGRALALEPALRERLFLIGKGDIKLVPAKRPAHRLKKLRHRLRTHHRISRNIIAPAAYGSP